MMNLDLYEYADPVLTTSTKQTGNEANDDRQEGSSTSHTASPLVEQSLNEEVNQVVQQLGSFWGGFRRQSETAFRQVVSQAQKELAGGNQSRSLGKEKASQPRDDVAEEPVKESASDSPTSTSQTSLFSRLQASLPSNLPSSSSFSLTSLKDRLPLNLKDASSNFDLAQLRQTMTSEVQRVQGLTRVQAEKYLAESENLLWEAGKALGDAVKVVPPEQSTQKDGGGLIWDGSDFWITTLSSSHAVESQKRSSTPAAGERAAATRSEALLHQLKTNSSILKVDPVSQDVSKEIFVAWRQQAGNSDFEQRISTVLDEKTPDSAALRETRDALVPSVIDESLFWERYFFRVYQIKEDEKRRRELLESTQHEEDIKWDDEDDEAASPSANKAPVASASSSPSVQVNTERDNLSAPPDTNSSRTSPRVSSDESYDVVSTGDAAAAAADRPSTSTPVPSKSTTKEADEDDSDWE